MPIVGDRCPPLAGRPIVRSESTVETLRTMTKQQKVAAVDGPRQQGKPVNSDTRRMLARKKRLDEADRTMRQNGTVDQSQRNLLARGAVRGTTGLKRDEPRGLTRSSLPPEQAVTRFQLEPAVRTDAVSYRLTRFGWCAVVPVLAVADTAATEAAALARARAAAYRRNGWVHGDGEAGVQFDSPNMTITGIRRMPTCSGCGLEHGGTCDD
jgi:hypothetical protein